ncbi:beta-lactamase superfamily II metal-dependent hydrolase [Desulfohalotomaculum tongense]|uniref:stalk domain-containing protein n=1 Tax=Desulforadius tongensis TaxID=1216062 RepID=UPI00195793DB|nr:stalk domain-containing protein [Desulforadius tongensis]MBM7853723.1 beta-lactamase superfamily II metal-dependent hydrolase [Desulforadius tongensis]
MKKKTVVLITALLACVLFVIPAYAGSGTPKLLVDDVELNFINPPQISKGTFMVPLAETVNKLGGEAAASKHCRTITAKVQLNDLYETVNTIKVTAGSKTAYLNGKPVTLPEPAVKICGVRKDILVPVKLVCRAFNYDVKINHTTGRAEVLTGVAVKPEDKYAWVHFIDVGRGEAAYIQLPGNKDILIDTGDREHGDKVVEYLKQHNVDDIDLLVITHTDAGAMGGVPAVLKAFPVKNIVDSGYDDHSDAYREYEYLVQMTGALRQTHASQTFKFDKGTVQILTQPRFYNDAKANSVAAYFKFGKVKVLFTGGMLKAQEKNLVGGIKADVLKVANGGSDKSTSKELLEKVNPQAAVISVSTGDQENEPAEEVLKRLQQRNILVYKTLNQHIILKTDGSRYIINQVPAPKSKKGTSMVEK